LKILLNFITDKNLPPPEIDCTRGRAIRSCKCDSSLWGTAVQKYIVPL